MVKRIKEIIILKMFFLVLLLLYSCRAEEEYLHSARKGEYLNIKTNSIKELKKQDGFNRAFMKIPKKKLGEHFYSIFGRSTMENQYGFTLIDAPVKVIEKDGKIYYTLQIISDDNVDGKIENLILSADDNADEIGYIIKYNAIKSEDKTDFKIFEMGIDNIISLASNQGEESRFIKILYSLCKDVGDDFCAGEYCGFGVAHIYVPDLPPADDGPFPTNPITGTGGGPGSPSTGTSDPEQVNVYIKTPTVPNNCPGCPEFVDNEEEEDDPCGNLKKLSNTSFYNQNIQFLKQKAAGSKEYALIYKYFPNTTTFASPTTAVHYPQNPNKVNIDVFHGVEWIGAFHNHTMGDKPTIKMFSPGDVEWLFVKARRKNNYQPPSVSSQGIEEMFLGLINVNEVYCLKIKDWNKFYSLNNQVNFKNVERELLKVYKSRDGYSPQIELQKDFLKIINDFDLGIGLFQQKADGTWDELTLDPVNPNNPPIKTPCN